MVDQKKHRLYRGIEGWRHGGVGVGVGVGGWGGGNGRNFDGGVPLLNAKTHPCLRETKGPDEPHV